MAANPLLTGSVPSMFGVGALPKQTPAVPQPLYGANGGINSQGVYNLLNGYGIAPKGANTTAQMLQNASGALYPLMGQQMQYGASLEPQRESAINDMIDAMGPSGINAQVASYGNAAQENAGTSARNAALEMGGEGMGSGATGGATANMFNSAAGQTNAYNAQMNSPQARQQQLQGMLSAISAGQQSPALTEELGLYNPVQSTAQFNQANQNYAAANSPLAQIGGLVGGGLMSAFSSGKILPWAFKAPAGTPALQSGGDYSEYA